MQIVCDMQEMDKHARYEDRYGQYLKFFQQIAETPGEEPITVSGAPASWVPLLQYLNCDCVNWKNMWFEHDMHVARMLRVKEWTHFDRTAVEVLCGFRPECTDALWKCDVQWNVHRITHTHKKAFIVTTNGGFWRREVLDYLRDLSFYVPQKARCVLVPCAADKPYPSTLHRAVLERLPRSYYMIVVTSVLGLVPQDMWSIMPDYDAGIPNEWRLMTVVQEYFRKYRHERVVVYADFNSLPIAHGMTLAGQEAVFVNEVKFYSDYLDLLDPARLEALVQALK